MNIYPINLLLSGKPALVVGGGKVAARKVLSLLKAGADIRVIAPDPGEKIIQIAAENKIQLLQREYKTSDLDDRFIVYAATSDRKLNAQIIKDANEKSIIVCAVDKNWKDGDFITPASTTHNDVTIAVSTHGVSCRKTKYIKENIAKHIEAIETSKLFILGTDHNRVPLERLGKILLTEDKIVKLGNMLTAIWGIQDFMILTTCNRIELIGIGNPDKHTIELLKKLLQLDTLNQNQYYYKTNFDAFTQISLTVSGLYSQTPGENHITSQFKNAFNRSITQNWSGPILSSLHDLILHTVKHIRTEVISKLKVCEIEEVTLNYVKEVLNNLQELLLPSVYIAGTGMVGKNLKDIFLKNNINIQMFYNSNKPDWNDVSIEPISKLKENYSSIEILITALSTDKPIINKKELSQIPQYATIIDLGSPSNIEKGKNDHKIIDLEELKHWYRRNHTEIKLFISEAEKIINNHRKDYERFRKSFIDGYQGQ